MTEPAGLSRSLDAMIAASQQKPRSGRGGGRGGSHAGRGGGRGQGIAGGVQKPQQYSDRGGGRGRGGAAQNFSRAPIQHNNSRQMPQMPQMPKFPQMPMMPMMPQRPNTMHMSEMEQLRITDIRMKQREKELELRERELRLRLAEQEIMKTRPQAAAVGARGPVVAPQARAPARVPFYVSPETNEDTMEGIEEAVDDPCECKVDPISGSVLVSYMDTVVVTVSRAGEVTLTTEGWWCQEVFDAMNKALKPINMGVVASGSPENANWSVTYLGQMRRIDKDDFSMPASGRQPEKRAALILASFKKIPSSFPEVGGDSAEVRRLQRQGRYY